MADKQYEPKNFENQKPKQKAVIDDTIKLRYYLSYGIGVAMLVLSIISFFALQYLSFLYLALSAIGIYLGYRCKEVMRSNTGYVLSVTSAIISILSIGVFIFLAITGYAF